ncbi:hypothetical protein E2C01_093458 [Portunus trituberculatus]|uniref:Uncharacterized protein n=1 Tax=Portunus trituberculatus TaxID=210409 RepID=A0A5B7JUU8_PORTR|nr:hypothetical protein [Portunus trituberculatus]
MLEDGGSEGGELCWRLARPRASKRLLAVLPPFLPGRHHYHHSSCSPRQHQQSCYPRPLLPLSSDPMGLHLDWRLLLTTTLHHTTTTTTTAATHSLHREAGVVVTTTTTTAATHTHKEGEPHTNAHTGRDLRALITTTTKTPCQNKAEAVKNAAALTSLAFHSLQTARVPNTTLRHSSLLHGITRGSGAWDGRVWASGRGRA